MHFSDTIRNCIASLFHDQSSAVRKMLLGIMVAGCQWPFWHGESESLTNGPPRLQSLVVEKFARFGSQEPRKETFHRRQTRRQHLGGTLLFVWTENPRPSSCDGLSLSSLLSGHCGTANEFAFARFGSDKRIRSSRWIGSCRHGGRHCYYKMLMVDDSSRLRSLKLMMSLEQIVLNSIYLEAVPVCGTCCRLKTTDDGENTLTFQGGKPFAFFIRR